MSSTKSDGSAAFPAYTAIYLVPLLIKPVTTLTAGTTYFSMRNTGNKQVFLLNAQFQTIYDGSDAGNIVSSTFSLERFSAATPSGGSTVTPAKGSSTFGATSIGDARMANSGLTTTGVSFDAALGYITVLNRSSSGVALDLARDSSSQGLHLLPGEGFCLRAFNSLTAGVGLTGIIVYGEQS